MSEGFKDDKGKPDPTLVPPLAEWAAIEVLDFGAKLPGYGPDNWRTVVDAKHRYLAACMRHISEYRRGSRVDIASGKHPLAHAVVDLLFVLQLELEERE